MGKQHQSFQVMTWLTRREESYLSKTVRSDIFKVMENITVYPWHGNDDEAVVSLDQLFNFLFGIIVTSIIAANLFIFTILISSKTLHSLPCFSLLTSLSLADLMTGWTSCFYWVTYLLKMNFNTLTCQLTITAYSAIVLVSFNHALVIAVDRLYAVLYPFNYKRKRSLVVSTAVVAGIWCVSAAIILCVVFTYTDKTDEYNTKMQCTTTILWGKNIGVVSIILIIYFSVAYAVIFSSYVAIYLKVQRQPSRRNSENYDWGKNCLSAFRKNVVVSKGGKCRYTIKLYPHQSKFDENVTQNKCVNYSRGKDSKRMTCIFSHGHDNRRRMSTCSLSKERKVHKMLLVLVGALLVFYIPSMCCYFFRVLGYQTKLLNTAESFAHSVIVMNSAINPFLYACRLPGFKKAVTSTCRRRRSNRNGKYCVS